MAILFGVVALSVRLPLLRFFAAVPELGQLDYSAEPFASLPTLSSKFILEALGAGNVAGLLAGGTLADVGAESASPTQGPGAVPRPTPGPLGPPGSDLVGVPDIQIAMSANKASARAGDTIVYTITLTNRGRTDATGVRVTSHIPEHTSYVAENSPCGEAVCVERGGPLGTNVGTYAPGPPAPGEHGYVNEGLAVPAGGRTVMTFSVAVDPDAPRGSPLTNHAHARAADAFPTSNEVSTKVE